MNSVENNQLAAYQADLGARAAEGQLRRCRLVEPVPESENSLIENALTVTVDGQPAVNFSSNDYLGLSRNSRLQDAAIAAIRQYGTGSGASRLISGTNTLVTELEQAICAFKNTEAALVFSSGYQANVAILQALLGPGDFVFSDKLNHASLVDGVLLSGAKWTRYRHLDLRHLEEKLAKAPAESRRWIVTDSVFSMDGDFPDLAALVDLAEKYNALVLVDEAHATGMYGDQRGSGLCEAQGVSEQIALQMGTFSKALGGAGAYVAGSKILIDTLINRARGFIYSTAPSPANIAAAFAAVQVVQTDSRLKDRLWENVRFFETCIQQTGLSAHFNLPLQSPIIPVLVGDSQKTVQLSQRLLEAGYFVQGIRPPTVPPGTARLRIALSAAHTPAQIAGLLKSLADNL